MKLKRSLLVLLSLSPLLLHAGENSIEKDWDSIYSSSDDDEDDEDDNGYAQARPIQVKSARRTQSYLSQNDAPIAQASSQNQQRTTLMGVGAEYLFWSASEDGLGFAADGIIGWVPQTAPFPSTTAGQIHNLPQKWDSGVRIAMDVMPSQKPWDLDVAWTWYQTSSHSGVSTRQAPIFNNSGNNPYNPEGLFMVWDTPGAGGNALSSANATWKLRYNTADLNLRRIISFGDDFILNPSIGIRGAWIHQNLQILTLLLDPTYDYPEFSGNKVMTCRQDFNAVGFRLGCGSAFYFTHCFSIYGDAFVSLLIGNFKIKETLVIDNFTAGISTPCNIKNHFSSVKTTLEAALGLRWEENFCNDQYQLEAHIGYEYQAWLDQNQLMHFTNTDSPISAFFTGGDLFLQGLTVGAGIKF